MLLEQYRVRPNEVVAFCKTLSRIRIRSVNTYVASLIIVLFLFLFLFSIRPPPSAENTRANFSNSFSVLSRSSRRTNESRDYAAHNPPAGGDATKTAEKSRRTTMSSFNASRARHVVEIIVLRVRQKQYNNNLTPVALFFFVFVFFTGHCSDAKTTRRGRYYYY